MKKEFEDQHVFRSEFNLRQEINDGIQTCNYYIKDELQNSIEDNIMGKRKKERSFWLHGDGLKEFLTMNSIEKHKNNEQNIRKHDISY